MTTNTSSTLATEAGMRKVAFAWTAMCILLGLAITMGLLQLRETGDALEDASKALQRTGRTISAFDGLPLVGDGVGAAGDRIAEQGARAQEAAESARMRITVIAIGLGVFIAFLGSTPVLLLWRVVAGLEQRTLAAAPTAT